MVQIFGNKIHYT